MALQDSFTGSPSSAPNFGLATWQAMKFTASSNYVLETIDLVMYDTAAADTDIGVELWGVTGGGDPNSADVKAVCAPVNTSTISATFPSETYTTFTFTTSFTLLSGTDYAIVASAPAVTNSAMFAKDDAGYATGSPYQSINSGVAWSGTSDDFLFKANGTFDPIGVTPADVSYSKKLVAVANNELWYESSSGTMEELTDANGGVDCSELLNMFEGYGKVFAANKANLKVADFQNVKITTADVASHPPDPGTVLTGGSSSASMVVDYITALSGACTIYGQRITSTTFTSGETVTGDDDDDNAISFATNAAEAAGPFWYDWTTYGNSTTYGALPGQATLCAMFRGRAVLSGNPLYPHQWYMSRQARPFDFLYGINDAQAAVAGNNADAGEIGDVVTALIPYKDDYFIFGCTDSIWYMTGDPTSGGSLDELDLTTGIFGANSWCWGKDNELYFWGTNGVYKVTLPGGSPTCVSEVRLPKLVDDEAADPTTHRITLSYDKRRAGICIMITKLSDGTNSDYWYDLRTNGIFPESYSANAGIYSSVAYDATDPSYKHVMYGCRDGYIRTHFEDQKDDDDGASDVAVSSYVTFGPFLLSDVAVNEGKVTGFDVILGGGLAGDNQSDSDGITYELYVGKSAQEVLGKMSAGTPISAAGVITGPGRSRQTFRKKVRGVYGGIKLKNVATDETWALEQALIDVADAGRLR